MRVYKENKKNFGCLGSFSTSDFSVYSYPGGMLMPGRHSSSTDYRFGYNGMEMDNEPKGNGNSYTTEFRQYDPRLMRWLSLDPLMMKFPQMSPYVAFNNNPIYFTDPLGLEGGPAKVKMEKFDCSKVQNIPEVDVSAEGLSAQEVMKNKEGAIRSQNPKYLSFLESKEAYHLSQDMAKRARWNSSYGAIRHRNNYRKYDWGRYDDKNAKEKRPGAYKKAVHDHYSEMLSDKHTDVAAGMIAFVAAPFAGWLIIEGAIVVSPYLPQVANFGVRQLNPFNFGKFTIKERIFSGLVNGTSQVVTNGGDLNQFDLISFGSSIGSGSPFLGNGLSSMASFKVNGEFRSLGNGISLQQATTSFTINYISTKAMSPFGNIHVTGGGPISNGQFIKYSIETTTGIIGGAIGDGINK